MNYINKINLVGCKTENIALFTSAVTDKLESMGLDSGDTLIKVCSEANKKESLEAEIRLLNSGFCANGLNYENTLFKVFCSGSSDIRKATYTLVKDSVIRELGTWAMCGLNTRDMKLAINKYMAYIGLLFSASKKFEDVFAHKIDIRRVAIIKDCENTVDAICDLVAGDNKITRKAARKLVINTFDGFGIVRDKLTNGESCTLRGPWLKAFVQAVNWSEIVAFCTNRGVPFRFVDFWGNEIDLKNVDIILTESCFKTAKLYNSWDQYCSAFEQLGHDVRVCVREHKPRLKGLPYQQAQTLQGNDADVRMFLDHAKKTVEDYKKPKKATSLLRGSHKKAVKLYPALLNESYTMKTIQDKYTTKRNDMLAGRIPELGYNAFIAPDMVAFMEHLFSLPVKGFLKAGECCCLSCSEGDVDVTRSPHLDNAHVILKNVVTMPFAKGPTFFINVWDTTTIQLRCDYDGDHVWYSQNSHLLDLVDRTYKTLHNLPIDWDVAKAEKVQVCKSNIAKFITNLVHGSEIGMYADALTKMWAQGYDRDVCDWLTYAGNVLIDAAKHAAVKIDVPKKVQELNNESLPLFAMYAKADKERPVGSDYWLAPRVTKGGVLPPRVKKTDCMLDKFNEGVQKEIPEVLEIEGVEDLVFDASVLMINPHRKVGKFSGLSKKGTYDPEKGTYVGAGLFQDIAFRQTSEWNQLVGDDSFFNNRKEWEEATAEAARKELLEYAHKQYPGFGPEYDDKMMDAMYDIIVRNVFGSNMKPGMETVIKGAFWRIFGDKAVEVLEANLAKSAPQDDDDDDEEEEDAE